MNSQQALELINLTPALQSILYDIGMLPEQVSNPVQVMRMEGYAWAYQAGLDAAKAESQKHMAESGQYWDAESAAKRMDELETRVAGLQAAARFWQDKAGALSENLAAMAQDNTLLAGKLESLQKQCDDEVMLLRGDLEARKRERGVLFDALKLADKVLEDDGWQSSGNERVVMRTALSATEPQQQLWLNEQKAEALEEAAELFEIIGYSRFNTPSEELRGLASKLRAQPVKE